jgi:hypothetical protein
VTKLRLSLGPILLLLVALMIVACGADDASDEVASDEVASDEVASDEMASDEMASDEMASDMGDMAMGGAPEGLDTSTERMTENGLFHVSVSSNLDPLALNEIHSWTVHVETADGQAVEGAEIAVDGGMPEHNHGFPTTPAITEELGGGDYLLDGVKFSMAGWWELKLTIGDGEQADDITFNLVLP